MNLQEIEQDLARLTNELPPTSAGDPNATLNYHMNNLYGILGGLANGISELRTNSITKTDLNNVIAPLHEATTTNAKDIEQLKLKTEQIQKNQETNLAGISEEIDNRLRKQNNVAIFGLPESTNPDPKAKRQADLKETNDLLADLDMNTTTDQAVKTTFRVRKSRNPAATSNVTPSPLIIVFKNIHYKEKMFRNVKGLKGNPRWSKISIKPDKTKLQQHLSTVEFKAATAEAKRKNDDLSLEEAAEGVQYVVRNQRGRSRVARTIKPNEPLASMAVFDETGNTTFHGFGA